MALAQIATTARDDRTAEQLLAASKLDAKHAGLRYVRDDTPGIRRKKHGKNFRYQSADGRLLRDEQQLFRIRKLAVPPAWTDVWICPLQNGHIQATGRDVRGRKQYRYHTGFRKQRDENKFKHLFDFALALPKIRARCSKDLAQKGLARDKVLAAVVRLLEHTLIRVGNEEYSRLNNSFGLTTLRDQHAKIRGARVEFRFRGKSGKDHTISFTDKKLATIVKKCRDIEGDELFQYIDDDGTHHTVSSSDVNGYLRTISGDNFTAKDFRTWAGTMLTALMLEEWGVCPTQRAAKRKVNAAIEATSQRLGNTPSICRKCYVHPTVLDTYMAGRVVPRLKLQRAASDKQLASDERAVIAFLRRHTKEAKAARTPQSLSRLLSRSVQAATHERGASTRRATRPKARKQA